MLFASITRPEDLQYVPNEVDGIEFRLDYFWEFPISNVILYTLRSTSHGGRFQGTEEQREELLETLFDKAEYLDLEYDMRPAFLEKAFKTGINIVLSYHNFEQTPDLEPIYKVMSKYPAFTYKIACMARSANDALRMLHFARTHPRVSAICMGEYGKFARILGPVAGNIIDFGSVGKAIAPGQLTAAELLHNYHSLNSQTALYGLIGDPVSKSLGHIYHNEVFKKQGINAIYVKMLVKEEELTELFPLIRALGFQGLSVTMPLKEKVLPFLDAIDPIAQQIGAVNTMYVRGGRLIGTNTDGAGALDALGPVREQHVVLIGAGGAARAIAFEAKARGARLTILNRTLGRAKALAEAINGAYGGLTEVPSQYDVLVNCSPNPMPIDPARILATARVMDIVYVPRETQFLQAAHSQGATVIYGDQMFQNQAAAQSNLWINKK